jgi:hypothetical protein
MDASPAANPIQDREEQIQHVVEEFKDINIPCGIKICKDSPTKSQSPSSREDDWKGSHDGFSNI